MNNKFQKKSGEFKYLNKNCWLAKTLKYAPYNRCQYCELKFHKCLFLQYQIISLALIVFFIVLSILINGKVSELIIICVFTLAIIYGYFFNKSTDKIIKANFSERRAREALKELNDKLEEKVQEQTKKITRSYEIEKKARLELERLDRAKDQFILTSQHHLRTPISGMSGYLDLIFTGTFGKIPKKLEGALLKFQSATKMLSKLIDEFLDISQFQLGRKVVTLKSDTELTPILEDILESVKAEAKKKGLSIKLEKDKSLKIIADEEKIKTALYNIIDNAVKYTNTGKVLIKANLKGSNVLIEVKDTGKGLSRQEMKLLFDKLFERGNKADKFYVTGMGIGLFMATLIIEAHNGKIWVESQGQGKGSSFFIQLPIK